MSEAQIVDKFWSGFNNFRAIRGLFASTKRWCLANLLAGKSYLWHKKCSLDWTTVLGFVEWWVTSKVAGIGACERNWGDVKKSSREKVEARWWVDGKACYRLHHSLGVGGQVIEDDTGRRADWGDSIWEPRSCLWQRTNTGRSLDQGTQASTAKAGCPSLADRGGEGVE